MFRRLLPIVVVVVAALAAEAGGWLAPLDNWLGDKRFALTSRLPGGQVALIDIDAKSIAAVGVWPWPRAVYARLIDRLSALDAGEIALDVDFSTPSDPEDDAALQAALDRADGSVVLVAFDQSASATGELRHTRPIERFADRAWLANVDVRLDGDGKVRRLPFGVMLGNEMLPSLAATLGGGAGTVDRAFDVDFGIRAEEIDRISASDVLAGTVGRERIAGKKLIVGATAVELPDFFTVPRYGAIPAVLLQALGAESLLQGRALARTNALAGVIGLVFIGLLAAGLRRRRWGMALAVLVGAMFVVEAVAIAVQALWPFEVATAVWQVSFVGCGLLTLLREINFRRIRLQTSRVETRNARAILDRVIADNFAGVLVVGADGVVLAASRSAAAILRISADLVGRKAAEILPPPLQEALVRQAASLLAGTQTESGPREVACLRKGHTIVLEYVATPSRLDGGFAEEGDELDGSYIVCLTFVDVTERHLAAERTAYLTRFDTLTRLANRNQFLERLSARLATNAAPADTAVICLDLDRFKTFNDTLGHSVGDLMLRAVAARLSGAIREGDFVARLGGDDFAIIVAGPGAAAAAKTLAERLVAGVGVPYSLDGHRLVVAVSAGIAVVEAGETDPLAALKRADIALYRAKAGGGNSAILFEPAMTAGQSARQILEVELWDAFDRGEFEVHYQPQVDLRDGRITGAEALARWRHPTRGLVSPAEFITVVEAIGLMEPLGRRILAEAAMTAAQWPEKLRVAVNVSAVQFSRGNLVEAVGAALEISGIDPNRLELEITESLFLQEHGALTETLKRIGALGVSLALDDFGTGYSSLAYIRKFPIDKVKIDRSFVADIPHNPVSVAIVRAVSALAEGLGVTMVAEGIEREEQVKLLRLLGCTAGQGYYFGPPLNAGDFLALVSGKPEKPEAERLVG